MYQIIRFHIDKKPRKVKKVKTLEEAQAHCKNPKTKGEGWFDGYTKIGGE